jgi:hypothetical protein
MMKKPITITGVIIQNVSFFLSYLVLLWGIINFHSIKLSAGEPIQNPIDMYLLPEIVPSVFFIFATVFCYILFLIVIGGSIAFSRQHYFSGADKSRFTLYILSIIPPVIVSYYLIDPNQFGQFTLTIFISYFIVSILLRISGLKKAVNNILIKHNNKPLFIIVDFIIEAAVFVVLCLLFSKTFFKNYLLRYDINETLGFGKNFLLNGFSRILFVILFNCINFLSVEYISNLLFLEIKKSSVKNYFLYENNPLKRLFYVFRSNITLVLNKIKLLIVWLVTSVLLFEVSYNDWAGLDFSIGKKILGETSYTDINGQYIFTISFVLYAVSFVIFMIFDILSVISADNLNDRKNDILIMPGSSKTIRMNYCIGRLFDFKKSFLKPVLAVIFIFVVIVTMAYSKSMNVLQHYDFNSSLNINVSTILKYNSYVDKDLLNKWEADDGKLCIRHDKGPVSNYKFVNFTLRTENKEIEVLPVVKSNGMGEIDSIKECYFLEPNGERFDVTQFYTIVDAGYSGRLYALSVFKQFDYIPYKMERSNKNEVNTKIFFPVLFFYILYFSIMLCLAFLACYWCYKAIIKIQVSSIQRNRFLKYLFLWARTFILSTPFLLLLYYINNFYSDPYNQISYIKVSNYQYLNSIVSYILICLCLLLYIIPGMLDDYYKYFNKLLFSEEMKYKRIIGMNNLVIRDLNEKYGYQKLKMVFIETILFLFVLLFFNSFCLNTPLFKDYLGSSMILSFENIFTKIFWARIEYIHIIIFHIILFICIYLVLLLLLQRNKKES